MIAAAGGLAAWHEVRQLGWLQGTVVDGMLVRADELVWDRTHQRLRHVTISPAGAVTIVMRPLAGTGGAASRILASGMPAHFLPAARTQVLARSLALMRTQSFLLALPFSLRSPGVVLELAGERVEPTVVVRNDEPPHYDILKVTRAGEVLYIVVSKKSRRPVLVERVRDDSKQGTRLEAWETVGGIRLATRRRDLASTDGATLAPFVIPPKWRHSVALSPFPVPAQGTVTLITAIAASPTVDPALFIPATAVTAP
ncbi:MAG TPA: hypothetical protein VFG83_09650 [Kofleriaceae bacterium]|nr:hypothetical protein [Kofleriaceae bacterium]